MVQEGPGSETETGKSHITAFDIRGLGSLGDDDTAVGSLYTAQSDVTMEGHIPMGQKELPADDRAADTGGNRLRDESGGAMEADGERDAQLLCQRAAPGSGGIDEDIT